MIQQKPEVLDAKSEGVITKMMWRSPVNDDFERFLKIYKEDKHKARVLFFHNSDDFGGDYARYSPTRGYTFQQLFSFERENGDFTIVLFTNKWGLSITSKMYKSQIAEATISFKKADNKFWLISRRKGKRVLLPLTLSNLRGSFGDKHGPVEEELQQRFGWLRYIRETNVIQNVAFNTVIRKKLFSYEAALRHLYKVPFPVAQKLHAAARNDLFSTLGHKSYEPFMRYIINIENISDEQAKSTMFWDTVRMARVLDRKVNCSWGDARMKAEHDAWSREITNILLDAKNRDLRLADIYKNFETFSGFKLLTTTRDMVLEGMVNKHCVASYIGKVDQGLCAIFHVEGHTLEVLKDRQAEGFLSLRMAQFKGLKNEEPPQGLKDKVAIVVNDFNKKVEEEHREMEAQRAASNNVFSGLEIKEFPGSEQRLRDQQTRERPMMLADDEEYPF